MESGVKELHLLVDVVANWRLVEERIWRAAHRVGRPPEDIHVVAVTKGVDVRQITPLIGAGISAIGENRIQEILPKYEAAPWREEVDWHFIGHLQTNKVRHCLQFASLVHSVDSLRLIREIDRRARLLELERVDVLLQVNISGEATKFGLSPDEVWVLLEQMEPYSRVFVQGLMTMAPHEQDPENTRPYFRDLRNLGEKLSDKGFPRFTVKYLSMGMTNDFEVAVEEGANLLRIGSAIFQA
ncbi:MAG: YggS family pyridoxal phosphate-dependent enzyme [Firmicutes bacterium]|nr:YggS family pyridoxal phosphate-dependent enzyme [Bacillota bacterium]